MQPKQAFVVIVLLVVAFGVGISTMAGDFLHEPPEPRVTDVGEVGGEPHVKTPLWDAVKQGWRAQALTGFTNSSAIGREEAWSEALKTANKVLPKEDQLPHPSTLYSPVEYLDDNPDATAQRQAYSEYPERFSPEDYVTRRFFDLREKYKDRPDILAALPVDRSTDSRANQIMREAEEKAAKMVEHVGGSDRGDNMFERALNRAGGISGVPGTAGFLTSLAGGFRDPVNLLVLVAGVLTTISLGRASIALLVSWLLMMGFGFELGTRMLGIAAVIAAVLAVIYAPACWTELQDRLRVSSTEIRVWVALSVTWVACFVLVSLIADPLRIGYAIRNIIFNLRYEPGTLFLIALALVGPILIGLGGLRLVQWAIRAEHGRR